MHSAQIRIRSTAGRRVRWLCALLIVLISGCSTQAIPAIPSSAATSTPAGSLATIRPTPNIAATATTTTISPMPTTNTPTISATTPTTQTVKLAPLAPLQTKAIVDRPLRNVRALTDGTRKYKTAQWGPGSPWIAAVPQDGPGMDVINSVTGDVVPIVTDTFVLEPNWTTALSADGARYDPSLLVQQVRDGQDSLALVHVVAQPGAAPPFWREEIATSRTPIYAPAFAADRVVYATGDQLVVTANADRTEVISTTGVLMTALSAQAQPALAWTPFVTNLEDVQTFVSPGITRPPYALSKPGEGLWLPRWAPSAARLALTSITGRIVSATDNGAQRYDLGPGDLPAWSPDSRWIAYAGASAGLDYTTRDLHLVDWQGQGPRLRLTRANDVQLYTSPSWSPEGTRLAFVEIDSGKVFVGDVPPR